MATEEPDEELQQFFAEVIPFDLLIKEESVHHAREDGRLRLEGKTYEVQDGDVIFFRFNV